MQINISEETRLGMPRLFVLNCAKCIDKSAPDFIEFSDFSSYLSKFGLNVFTKCPVWKLCDLLNVDGSLDLRLIARPSHWTTFMIEIWQSRLERFLGSEL